MRAKEMRERSAESLREMAATFRRELFEAKFKNHANDLYDWTEIRKKRKDLARVLTVLRERELEAALGEAEGEQTAEAEG